MLYEVITIQGLLTGYRPTLHTAHAVGYAEDPAVGEQQRGILVNLALEPRIGADRVRYFPASHIVSARPSRGLPARNNFV